MCRLARAETREEGSQFVIVDGSLNDLRRVQSLLHRLPIVLAGSDEQSNEINDLFRIVSSEGQEARPHLNVGGKVAGHDIAELGGQGSRHLVATLDLLKCADSFFMDLYRIVGPDDLLEVGY
jgi:hypothetical protein